MSLTNEGLPEKKTDEMTEEKLAVDAEILLEVSVDNMTAFLLIMPPSNGGHEATVEQVHGELGVIGITTGIDTNAINDVIRAKEYGKKMCIARGKQPIAGANGKIRYFFKPTAVLTPKTDESGLVDYKDMGLVKNITTGTPIAKILPPEDGIDGIDVYGNVIPAEQGKLAVFEVGAGTELNELGTEILAATEGNLKWAGRCFVVEETLIIKGDIDSGTGNIDFIGNVIVKGEVKENFVVVSKKNITIGTIITGATLIADGDITIGYGSINSDISAGGDVKLNFCENTKIECGNDITVQSCVSSELFCDGFVNAITGKGAIIGGKCTALGGINANIIGTETFTKTTITLGNNAVLAEEKLQLMEQSLSHEANIKKLIQITELLQEHKKKFGPLPPDRESMLATSIRARFTFQKENKQIAVRIREIDALLEKKQNLQLTVRKDMWPGVSIRIGTQMVVLKEKYMRSVVSEGDDGEIVIVPIAKNA